MQEGNGGIAKLKRNHKVETRSVRPCLESSQLEHDTPLSNVPPLELSSLANSSAVRPCSVANPVLLGVSNPVLSSGATNSPTLTVIDSSL